MKNVRETLRDGGLYRDLVRESVIAKKHKKANMEGPEENNNPREFIAENAQAVLDDIFVSSDVDSEENYNLDSIFISKKLKTILDEVI